MALARPIDENVFIGEEDELHEPNALQKFYTRWGDLTLGGVAVILFLALWEWAGTSGAINPLFTSAPSRVVTAFIRLINDGELGHDIVVSGLEFVYGFGLAIIVGIPFGILMGWYRWFNAVLEPFVNFFYATPRVALLPLMIIWLGIGINSKIAIVYLGAIFAILINTITGMRALDASQIKMARSFGANDMQVFKTIALPGSVPFILGGIRLGLGHALVGIVVGELYAATAGVGYLIAVAGNTFQTDKVFVGIVIIAGAGMLLTAIFKRIEDHFDSWRPERSV
ncbi:MAG TPA: ABC transporter permease [Chloroflexota bacterium]|nr:ABC transporter permease [Chloroflexota bacterium]